LKTHPHHNVICYLYSFLFGNIIRSVYDGLLARNRLTGYGLGPFKHGSKIQLGKIRVAINAIRSVYGGLPVGETALQL
jgi:hypothetical protein